MRLTFRISLLLACFLQVVVSSILHPRQAGTCSQPSVRAPWVSLSRKERLSYIAATKCLKTKPSITRLPNSKNLFDDFVAVHITLDDNIHNVAAMLPWHSGFVHAREIHLRRCGFVGRMPGWNWTTSADLNDPFNDPVFDARDGLGGDGNPRNRNTIRSGPFANFRVNLVDTDNQIALTPHYLKRQFNSDDGSNNRRNVGFSSFRNSATMRSLQAQKSYQDFRLFIEGAHSSLHDMVGGDMSSIQSPNDPLFFLHHAQIDLLWRNWQMADTQRRRQDYFGNLGNADEFDGPFKASLNDKLRYFNLIPDLRVQDVMNNQGSTLCYTY